MAKVDGPLFSFSASGTIADTITFSKWKGRPYVRQRVIPSNPKSGLQVSVRALMKFLSQEWADLSAADHASWQDLADQIVASTFNAYTKQGLTRWTDGDAPRQDASVTSGTQPTGTSFTATGAVGQATIQIDSGTPNDLWGWVIYRSTTMGFTPSRADAVAFIANTLGNDPGFVDTPLAADTYYYDCKPFVAGGTFGSLLGEESAVVT